MAPLKRDTRTPLSLRLPAHEVSIVDKFARSNRISKTDAFLYFLRRGIEMEGGVGAQLEEIKDTLAKLVGEKTPSTPTPLDMEEVRIAAEFAVRDFPAIEKVILFGSFARGDATSQSDIDLRLELSEEGPFSLFDLARFIETMEKQTGREIDVVTAKELKNPNFARAIKREGIPIYERTRQ